MALLTAAVLATVAVASWPVPRSLVRTRVVAAAREDSGRDPGLLLPVGVGLGVLMIGDGVGGVVLGVTAGFLVQRWQRTNRGRADVVAHTQRALAMPVALDVLAACFAIGASPERALRAVASGVAGRLGDDLDTVGRAMASGADTAEAWSLVDAPDLQSLGAILTRTRITGAPVTPLLVLLADQQRQRARAVAMDAARALGVRVAGPLGLCFLPAFLLVAVVPLVLSLLPFGQ